MLEIFLAAGVIMMLAVITATARVMAVNRYHKEIYKRQTGKELDETVRFYPIRVLCLQVIGWTPIINFIVTIFSEYVIYVYGVNLFWFFLGAESCKVPGVVPKVRW